MSNDVVYISNSRIERVKGPRRRAYLPVESDPIWFGVHSEVAEHYGVDTNVHDPHATTLDYVIAAAAGWLTGTFGGALEARQIPAGEGFLTADVRGEVEKDDNKVLIIKRIHVTYYLKTDAANYETANRVHSFHADYCPVYKSIHTSIDITTELNFIE